MPPSDLSLMIGGPAGSGVNPASEIFMKACSRAGVFVFTNVEYHSNIHGRHIFFRIRTADEPVTSHVERVDVLLALDAETIYGTDPHQDYQSHKGHLHEVVSRRRDCGGRQGRHHSREPGARRRAAAVLALRRHRALSR